MFSRIHSCIYSTTIIHPGARSCAASWKPLQKPDKVLAGTMFRIDGRIQTNTRQSMMSPGGQRAVSGGPAWGPRCLALLAEFSKMTQNLPLIPGSSPSHPSLVSAGLPRWGARPSENGGVWMWNWNLSLDPHWPSDLKQIIHLSKFQFLFLLKYSN